jgi:GntR family transcriptional regulator
MFDNINIHSSVSVYEQIENQVKFAIASGRVKPGERLPTVHQLAEKFHVNVNTVAKAYRDLQVMGLLNPRRGFGVFVREDALDKCREACAKQVVGRLHEAISEAKAAGMGSREIKSVISQSYASGATPYGPVPDNISALAKSSGTSK